jgi:hypothetical protein
METNRAREIYERNKERSLKARTKVFSVREWLLALFAFVGLVLTAITTYFATIRTIDEVRVVVNNVPSISWTGNKGRFESKLGMTLVNSGNRSAAITAIFFEINKDASDCESLGDSVRLGFSSEAFVLKPGEVVVKSLNYSKESTSTFRFPKLVVSADLDSAVADLGDDKAKDGSPRSPLWFESGYNVAVCLGITYVTPNAHRTSQVLLYAKNTGESFLRDFFVGRRGLDTSAPWIIVRETGSIFGATDTTPRMKKSVLDLISKPAPPQPTVYP